MPRWSLDAVEKAAPDASSLSAARKLATPGPWSETGSTDTLLWGRCQGSGRTPYQVSIDLNGPAYRCSCPSRKFPCKHALALLLLWIRSDGAVETATETADFAAAWAQQRAERATAAATPSAAPDPEARARRLEARLATMSDGMTEFGEWLGDLARAGLAAARRQPWSWWDTAAARLVDAQLPGLAERVRDMSSAVHHRADWAEHLLAETGRWWTAVRAWRDWAALDDATRGDLRTYLGWAWSRDDVRTGAEPVERWQVLGAHRTDLGRLQEQRTWLRADATGEIVQVLDFAAIGQVLPVAQLDGSVLDAAVARYPGHGFRRALFVAAPVPVGDGASLPPGRTLADARGVLAGLAAANPWAVRAPVVVRGSITLTDPDRPPELVDADGATVPLLTDEPWPLLARTGGHPADLFGELDARGLRPLTIGAGA